jgi:hypothetical protein
MGRAAFAARMRENWRALMRRLVDDALRAEAAEGAAALRLRFEPLLWGGDDVTFALPAWRLLDCLAGLFETTAGWEAEGRPLRFTGGAVIAAHKAPVRRLRELAREAVELSKAGGARGGVTIDVFESVAPPEDGLAAHRARAFGGSGSPAALAFPAERLGGLVTALARLRVEAGRSLPSRSSLMDIVALAEAAGPAEADAVIARELVRLARALEAGAPEIGDLRLPALQGVGRPAALDLRLALALWDYAGAPA